MAVRNIRKQLAGVEDLLLGKGKQDQERSAGIVSITKIDIPAIVETIDELRLVDINKYTTAIVKDIDRGGTFIYIASNLAINNGGTIFNGWTKQIELPVIVVETTDDLSLIDTVTYSTAIVKDIDRGGTFIYDSSKVLENNGGTIFNGWTRQYDGAVDVKWFGAVGDGITDDTVAINSAIAFLAVNTFERGTGLYCPAGIYRITSTININLSIASLTIFSDTKATIKTDVPDGDWTINVDYSTGGTANFPHFSMTNIGISDLTEPRNVKNGLRTARVIGSRFVKCDFEYLNVAVDMGDDSNLNTFDTCQWRGNTNGWKSTDGVANNNLFLNCQWRYHSGTAFDSTGTDGNIIDCGDFEPYNASPSIIATGLVMRNVRWERNGGNGQPGIIVLNNNQLTVNCHSDGGTQVAPLFDVQGSGNNLSVKGSGASAAVIRAGAKHNITEIPYFKTLVSPIGAIYYCEDNEATNILKVGSSLQGNATTYPIIEACRSEIVPGDLSLWSATDCTVASLGNGGYRVTVTGGTPSLTYTPSTGTYSNINIAVTATASLAASQPRMTISGGTTTEFALSNGWPSNIRARKVISTKMNAIYTNPTFAIKPIATAVGSHMDIYNLRTSQHYLPE